VAKRQELLDSAEADPATLYAHVVPPLELGLPFVGAVVAAGYFDWPKLPELLPVSYPGVKTSRDDFLVAIDRDTLERRLDAYFDPAVSHEEMRARFPSVMAASGRFDPIRTRDTLRGRGCPLRLSPLRCALALLGT